MEARAEGPMPPVCEAALFMKTVDAQLNKGAIQEFAEATNNLQPLGADLGEGSAYLDDSDHTFTPQFTKCNLCEGTARLFEDGSVNASLCSVSGCCEVRWITDHPDEYKDKKDGRLINDRLLCNAELGCSALIALVVDADGNVTPNITRGECKVAKQGVGWRERYLKEVEEMVPTRPEAGIEEYDPDKLDEDEDKSSSSK